MKKGEKGIKIIAPMPKTVKLSQPELDEAGKPNRDENGKLVTREVERSFVAYKVVSVFDVSQTDGKPLPSLIPEIRETPSPNVLSHPLFLTLEKVSPVPIDIDMPPGTLARGMYSPKEKKIYIDHRRSETMVLKTMIHEIAHARLHGAGLVGIDRQSAEVQAESIAYTVCAHYGIDTSDYSFGYIAGWSSGKDAAELKASLDIIRTEAAAIIEKVDENYPIEYDRWVQEHSKREQLMPDVPAPLSETEVFQQMLLRDDMISCGVIAGAANLYEEYLAKLQAVSRDIAQGADTESCLQQKLDAAAMELTAYYEAMAQPDFSDLRGTLEVCKREAAQSLANNQISCLSIKERMDHYKAEIAQRTTTLPHKERKQMEVQR